MTQEHGVKLTWDRDVERKPAAEISDAEWVFPAPIYSSDNLFGTTAALNIDREFRPINRLIQGDNLKVMEQLLDEGYRGKIDLIYIDPPYFSESRYDSKIELEDGSSKIVMQRKVFDDNWENGINSYLNHIFPRLQLMKELLSEQGSIFVHLDWHVSHYVKLLLDEIFSPAHLINEIIWCYGGGSGAKRHFHRKHDVILWYSRASNYIFNPQYRPYTEGTLERGLTRVKGNKYRLREEGAIMSDWWIDISKILSPTAHENLKFPTQKPLALIKRIVDTASRPGSLVADFYCGSGTLADACDGSGRSWIACDNSPVAIHTTMHRLIKKASSPYILQKTVDDENSLEPLKNVTAEVHSLKAEGSRVFLSLQQAVDQHAQNLLFWALDLSHHPGFFKSDIQIIRERPKGKLPLDITVRLPAGPLSIGIKAYDWWGKEYYNNFNWK